MLITYLMDLVFYSAKNKNLYPKRHRPTSGGAVLRSKLVDRRCQVKFPAAFVDQAIWSLQSFFFSAYPTSTPTTGPDPTSGELALTH